MTVKRVTANVVASANARANTLGISARELASILDELDEQGNSAGAKRHRDFVRWTFRQVSIPIELNQPDGSRVSVKVACRNLSRGGMSILHNSYWHSGTRCTVLLPHNSGRKVPVVGFVTRCRHVRGMIHEVGIRFEEPIDTNEYVDLDPFSDRFSLERVKPEDLSGCVLQIDDSPMDQRLVRHYLRQTQLRIRTADTAEEGLEKARETIDDLILCDYHLADMNGVEVIEHLREEGVNTPVIMVTSDTNSLTKERMSQVQADAFLAKPIKADVLLRAIAEFLVINKETDQFVCSLPKDDPNITLAEEYIDQLHDYANRLEKLITTEDAMAARSICLQIKGTCPTLGFEGIGTLAEEAEISLAASMSVSESLKQLRPLVAACQRARTSSG